MKTVTHCFAWILGGSFALTGCTVGPNYQKPALAAPAAWKASAHEPSQPTPAIPAAWWSLFGDPVLDRVVAQVLAANHDLEQAAARVTEARALARMSAAERLPQVTLDATHTQTRVSGTQAEPLGAGFSTRTHSAQLGFDYELDFWGRVRRSVEAAVSDAEATQHLHDTAALLLTAEAARAYWQIRSLDAETAVLDATAALRRDAVRLQTTRHEAGLINQVDVTRARTELAGVEAELHALRRVRDRTEHALAALCGEAPATFALPANRAALVWPEIPSGLPSDLLERRPDLAAAERELAASTARIGVAKAEFFPRISLTGFAGFASADLNALTRSDSRTGAIGPGLHLPLFDHGRNSANLAASEARQAQAFAAYRAAVLGAFREVEDALSDLGTLAEQRAAVERALVASRDTVALATERYQKGLSNYLDVVDAQRVSLQTERLAVQLDGQRSLATVDLAKALGGGWNAPATPASP
ncbi:MAG: efflux transporter outer membrane subunit [Opitutaceae bacterium]|nr:efflux transporter outer membrane subunit [Opitutaceae bacterium]